jgi:hypothetical protein
MSVSVKVLGTYNKTHEFLRRMQGPNKFAVLTKYGPIGVSALKQATPKESGDTANSWYYEIVNRPGYFAIHWLNSHIEEPGSIPIAVILQYGHGTRTGGFVQGRDYINPALRPIFDQMVSDMWKEVTK